MQLMEIILEPKRAMNKVRTKKFVLGIVEDLQSLL